MAICQQIFLNFGANIFLKKKPIKSASKLSFLLQESFSV